MTGITAEGGLVGHIAAHAAPACPVVGADRVGVFWHQHLDAAFVHFGVAPLATPLGAGAIKVSIGGNAHLNTTLAFPLIAVITGPALAIAIFVCVFGSAIVVGGR